MQFLEIDKLVLKIVFIVISALPSIYQIAETTKFGGDNERLRWRS